MFDGEVGRWVRVWVFGAWVHGRAGHNDGGRGSAESNSGGLFEDVFHESPVEFRHGNSDDEAPTDQADDEHEGSDDGDECEPETDLAEDIAGRRLFGSAYGAGR